MHPHWGLLETLIFPTLLQASKAHICRRNALAHKAESLTENGQVRATRSSLGGHPLSLPETLTRALGSKGVLME